MTPANHGDETELYIKALEQALQNLVDFADGVDPYGYCLDCGKSGSWGQHSEYCRLRIARQVLMRGRKEHVEGIKASEVK